MTMTVAVFLAGVVCAIGMPSSKPPAAMATPFATGVAHARLESVGAADLLAEDEVMVVDAHSTGFAYSKVPRGSTVDVATNESAAIHASLVAQREEEEAEAVRRAALQEALSGLEPGAVLNTSTPRDGHCLFHALLSAGVGSRPVVPRNLAIKELRALALSTADPEALEKAAAASGKGISVEEYKARMAADAWGDNLVCALARSLARSITVVGPNYVRTWTSDGSEHNGADPLVELGLAVSDYIAHFDYDPWSNDPYLHADHDDDDAETIVCSDVEPLF